MSAMCDTHSGGDTPQEQQRFVVNVRTACTGTDGFVTRSQARQLLMTSGASRTIVLDFTGVESIGRSFADEIFRVFAREHPQVLVIPIHASPAVVGIITAVRSGQQTGTGE
jgi:hypothetical protein